MIKIIINSHPNKQTNEGGDQSLNPWWQSSKLLYWVKFCLYSTVTSFKGDFDASLVPVVIEIFTLLAFMGLERFFNTITGFLWNPWHSSAVLRPYVYTILSLCNMTSALNGLSPAWASIDSQNRFFCDSTVHWLWFGTAAHSHRCFEFG